MVHLTLGVIIVSSISIREPEIYLLYEFYPSIDLAHYTQAECSSWSPQRYISLAIHVWYSTPPTLEELLQDHDDPIVILLQVIEAAGP